MKKEIIIRTIVCIASMLTAVISAWISGYFFGKVKGEQEAEARNKDFVKAVNDITLDCMDILTNMEKNKEDQNKEEETTK